MFTDSAKLIVFMMVFLLKLNGLGFCVPKDSSFQLDFLCSFLSCTKLPESRHPKNTVFLF